MTLLEALFGMALFTAILVTLAGLVQVARSRLAAAGPATITINDSRELMAPSGSRLLRVLGDAGVILPAACGGGGTCGLCRVSVIEGAGSVSPVESAVLSRSEARRGVRLACQVRIRDGLRVRVSDEAFGVKQLTCRVRRARSLTPLIRELVLELPAGSELDFRAGAFVQVTCPRYRLRMGSLPVAVDHPEAWDRLGLSHVEAVNDQSVTRAYSLANHPGELGIAMLDVRIALPPPSLPQVPPGVVSTWLFSLREGDEVSLHGPHGHFFVEEGESELVFIGGGVGMAPLRAHVFDQLERRRSRRPISLWYGARSREDLFYTEEFERLAREHENFSWHVALSDPRPGDDWEGETGFIHQVAHDEYLSDHRSPEDCAYYLCGPPMMIRATLRMLDALGVEPESIFHDDFGT